MAKPKPLMTPEQQKMFKKAVADKAIQPVKYEDYCKITPEQADEMLKAAAAKAPAAPGKAPEPQKQEAPEKTPERKAPEIKDPDSPATKFQKRAIAEAVKAGQMERLPEDQWNNLTKGGASRIIAELHAKQPPAPATDSQMQEIEKLVKDGRIYPMKTETYNSLSKDKASTLIGIGRMNQEQNIRVEGYDPDYVSRRDQPKTPEQEAEITRLVKEKRLNPVPFSNWKSLTQGEAGKLIYIGQQREAANELAPERDKTHERDAASNSEKGKSPAKRPAPSRADDMPM